MKNQNIAYSSKEILDFYSTHRQQWDELYPSEQWVFNRIAQLRQNDFGDIFDAGCAGGGLASALNEKFAFRSYTGIDIHREVIGWAQQNHPLRSKSTFIADDVLKHSFQAGFDMVVSFSCVDWNIRTDDILRHCWNQVKPGGFFVISLRTVLTAGINDIKKSYQYITFSTPTPDSEIAPYVVFNIEEAIDMLKNLTPRPALVGGYGYWGKPSSSARTPFEKILFSVFYIQKPLDQSSGETVTELKFPDDVKLKGEKA